jgi:hypothetical protein
MLDTDKIRKSVAVLGWPKAMYSACLVLLVTRAISFDQCLVLVFVAWVLEIVPTHSRNKIPEKQKLFKAKTARIEKLGPSTDA